MSSAFSIQGVSIEALAAEYGTPMYVYDAAVLQGTMAEISAQLHPRLEIFFSLKANPNMSVCAVLHAAGACAEVSSLAELQTALRVGVNPDDVMFLGPGKSREEIEACLDVGIYAVICESFGELELIDGLARERDLIAPVVLRINPSFAVKGSGLTMGGKPRQFGIDEDQLTQRSSVIADSRNVRLMGVQVYLGTRILTEAAIVENTQRIFALAERIAAQQEFDLELVDIGGGLGVAYFDGERDLDLGLLAADLNPVVETFAENHPATRIVMELGRYLTAASGVYVVRVRYTKDSMGERFAVADGGTNHHMAAVGIGSFVKRNFPIELLNRVTDEALEPWNITGPLCTPNDVIGRKCELPPLRPGDLIGVMRSGAYGPTASPVLFLSHGFPVEVMLLDGRPWLIREADTPDSLLRRQRLVELQGVASAPRLQIRSSLLQPISP